MIAIPKNGLHQCQGLYRTSYTAFRSIDSRNQVEMEEWSVI